MLSWGCVIKMRREEEFATRIGDDFLADQFKQSRARSLTSFEQHPPVSCLEVVQWLRALGNVAACARPSELTDNSEKEEFRRMVGAAMWGIYRRRADATGKIRRAALTARRLANASSSTDNIAARLLETLRPVEFGGPPTSVRGKDHR